MDLINKEYEQWLRYAIEDEDVKAELLNLKEDTEKLNDSFYRNLEFGTGGLRGVIGAGTNRMNIYVIRKATQGLANYLLSTKTDKKPSVAIAYDSRIKSDLFAKEAARVLAGNGIKVFIYEELMPTPALSFAVRNLKCDGGICVTASHNPSKYNGYKVYGSDGCQMTIEAANMVLNEIEKINPFKDVKIEDFELSINNKDICYITKETVDEFIATVKKESLTPIKTDLHVVYTPLNGSGRRCVTRILDEIGVKKVTIAKEQEMPDGNFTTCPYPNPEKKEALSIGLRYCEETKADLLLATDPDCDRVGIAIKHNEEYILLTGNETGVLLLDYICQRRIELDKMPKDPVSVKTIVTTTLVDKVAKHYGVEIINVLTGFKFIGEQIGFLEEKSQEDRYIFGFEESYGYLSGTYARDKDGVNGSMLICEMTSFYKEKGLTLIDRLEELYKQHGYHKNQTLDFTFEGEKGIKFISDLMNNQRTNKLQAISDYKVVEVKDYEEPIGNLPKSNVLEYHLEDGSKVIIRPSGTEPKIKIYMFLFDYDKSNVELKCDKLQEGIKQALNL